MLALEGKGVGDINVVAGFEPTRIVFVAPLIEKANSHLKREKENNILSVAHCAQ